MNLWNFFTSIIVINLPERTDRLDQVKEELSRVGILAFGTVCNYYVQIIPGIANKENPVKGFNEAQWNALNAAKGITLVLEDDVIFKDYEHLEAALYELPEDWDLLYLGANIIGTDLCRWPVPEKYSQHLSRVKQAWTTHAIAYSPTGIKKLLETWDYKHDQIFDDVLRCNIEEKLNAYIVNPMVADQRKGFSDIWNCNTDYGFFKQGNERMAI